MAFQDDIDEPPQKIWYAQDKQFRSYIHPELLKLAFKFVEISSYKLMAKLAMTSWKLKTVRSISCAFPATYRVGCMTTLHSPKSKQMLGAAGGKSYTYCKEYEVQFEGIKWWQSQVSQMIFSFALVKCYISRSNKNVSGFWDEILGCGNISAKCEQSIFSNCSNCSRMRDPGGIQGRLFYTLWLKHKRGNQSGANNFAHNFARDMIVCA